MCRVPNPFISASGSQGLVCGVAAVCTVASWSGDSVDPESACSLRSRPPELFALEPFHADVSITSKFNGLPFAVELTAPVDGVQLTRRIKSMSLRRVGPTQ